MNKYSIKVFNDTVADMVKGKFFPQLLESVNRYARAKKQQPLTLNQLTAKLRKIGIGKLRKSKVDCRSLIT